MTYVYFLIVIVALIWAYKTTKTSVRKNETLEEMDQKGPWKFWGAITLAMCGVIGWFAEFFFGTYVVTILSMGIAAFFFVPYVLKNYTGTVPGDEVWCMGDRFFAHVYIPTGGKKWLILTGKYRAWFPWNYKGKVLKLRSYKTDEIDIELEPKDNKATLNSKLSSTFKIVGYQEFAQASEESDVVAFVSDRLLKGTSEQVQDFTAGKHTVKELRTKGGEIMAKMHLPTAQGGMGPLPEESLYGVQRIKTTLSQTDLPADVKKSLGAAAIAENLAKAAAIGGGKGYKQLPPDSPERKYWHRQAMLGAEIEGVRENTHNIELPNGASLPPEAWRVAAEAIAHSTPLTTPKPKKGP